MGPGSSQEPLGCIKCQESDWITFHATGRFWGLVLEVSLGSTTKLLALVLVRWILGKEVRDSVTSPPHGIVWTCPGRVGLPELTLWFGWVWAGSG